MMSGRPPLHPSSITWLLGALLLLFSATALAGQTTPAHKVTNGKAAPTQQAKGAVNAGHLEHASRLHNSGSVRLRFPRNAWGTRRLVDLIQRCSRHVQKQHRGAHRLLVGDLSRKRGGPMPPHAGHQNGREADIGFYMRSGRAMPGLWRVGPGHLDAKRTLTFITCLIDSRQVMRIFLDRRLQAPLAREAKRRKWSKARISRTFSWPRGRRTRVGLVQHRNGHYNHLHVRLRCDSHERGCRNGPVARRNAHRARRRVRRRGRRRGKTRRRRGAWRRGRSGARRRHGQRKRRLGKRGQSARRRHARRG